MSAADYPVVMCDDESGCEEWALDHTLHGLARLVGSATQLPDGWAGDAPGTGHDEQFCPQHTRVTPPVAPGRPHHLTPRRALSTHVRRGPKSSGPLAVEGKRAKQLTVSKEHTNDHTHTDNHR